MIFVVLCSFPALADDSKVRKFLSAASTLDACKESPSESDFQKGSCLGQIHILYMLAFMSALGPETRFCPPDGTTIDQARRVVIKHIDDRPEELDRPFLFLAIEALRKAWPCPEP